MRVPVILLFFGLISATKIECPPKYKASCIEISKQCQNGKQCSALYGGGHKIISLLNDYANEQIYSSLQFLLMSTHMGNYKRSREGLRELYRVLSDKAWEDGIDIMQHITLRGEEVHVKTCDVSDHTESSGKKSDSKKNLGKLEPSTSPKKSWISENSVALNELKGLTKTAEMEKKRAERSHEIYNTSNHCDPENSFTLNELKGLAKAVEIKKKLADRAHQIYNKANPCDPEVGSYLKNKFLHRDAEMVRKLVGLTNDLKHLLDSPEHSSSSVGLSHFIMDEYIKSVF